MLPTSKGEITMAELIKIDRNGTLYVKNFFIMPNEKGWSISVQRFTSKDPKIKTKHLKEIERSAR